MEKENQIQNQLINMYKFILENNPQDIRIINTLAKVYLENKEEENAVNLLYEAIKINPCDGEAFNTFGTIYFEKKDYKKAYLHFRKAVDFDKFYYKNHYDLAKALIGLNEFENAKISLKTCLKLNPDFELANVLLKKLG